MKGGLEVSARCASGEIVASVGMAMGISRAGGTTVGAGEGNPVETTGSVTAGGDEDIAGGIASPGAIDGDTVESSQCGSEEQDGRREGRWNHKTRRRRTVSELIKMHRI